MINTIRQKIQEKLATLDTIQEVNDYERVGFEGFPAINITFSGNDSSFYSVASNQRAYNFKIMVFVPLNGDPSLGQYDNSKQKAEMVMGDVVDQIIDAFDTDITLGRTVDQVGAVPSRWGYVPIGEGYARTAEINIQAIKSIRVRS